MLDSRHVLNSSEWDITTDLVTAGHMRQMHGVLYPAQEKSPADQHRLGRPLPDQAAAVDQGGVDTINNCFMDFHQLELPLSSPQPSGRPVLALGSLIAIWDGTLFLLGEEDEDCEVFGLKELSSFSSK